jgi:hypothetical protein
MVNPECNNDSILSQFSVMLLLTNGTVNHTVVAVSLSTTGLRMSVHCGYSCIKLPEQTGLEREKERDTDFDNRERCMTVLVVQHEGECHKRSLILRFVQQAPVVTLIMCFAICRITPLKHWTRPWNKPSHSAVFGSSWSAVFNDAVN